MFVVGAFTSRLAAAAQSAAFLASGWKRDLKKIKRLVGYASKY
ncbi:hypothetical protein [Nostoc sp.]